MTNILHWNVNSLMKHQDELITYLNETKPDVICLNETKLRSRPAPNLPGYNIAARSDRTNNLGGGTSIYTKEGIHTSDVTTEEEDCCATEIEIQKQKVTIISAYWGFIRQPSTQKIQQLIQGKEAILLGDFNAKHPTWEKTCNERGRLLHQMIKDNSLIVLNKPDETTFRDNARGTGATIDLGISTPGISRHITDCHTGEPISGGTLFHLPIHIKMRRSQIQMKQEERRLDIKKCDWNRFKEELKKTKELPTEKTQDGINQAARDMAEEISKAFHSSCPMKKTHQHRFRVSPETLQMIQKKRKTLREMKKYPNIPALKTIFNQQTKEVRRAIKKEKEERLVRTTTDLQPRDGKKFWQQMNKLRDEANNTTRRTNRNLQREDGSKTTNQKETADLFAETQGKIHRTHSDDNFDKDFKAEIDQWTEDNNNLFKPDFDEDELENTQMTRPITPEEILQQMKTSKTTAPGEDGIQYTQIKQLPQNYLQKMSNLMNTCMKTGYYPDVWKSAVGTMIPKPDKDHSIATNYRPISLLSCIGKTFEKIISRRLQQHLEEIDFINPWQRAYQKKKEGTEHLHRLSEQLKRAAEKKWITYLLLLDVEKAFDSVWQNGLRKKIHQLGLPDQTNRLISSFLTDRTIRIKIGDAISDYVHLAAGTPQGSVLSPLLFIIYVNDIPIDAGTNTTQYADDLGLYIQGKNQKYIRGKMQRQINKLEDWCNRWYIKLNAKKTQLITLPTQKTELELYGTKIKPTQQGKLLGMLLDDKRTYRSHVNNLIEKAERRLNLLRVLAGWRASYGTMRHVYTSYIRPVMETGFHFTTYLKKCRMNQLQQVQNKAMRTMLRLPTCTRISLLHQMSQLQPIKDHLSQLHNNAITRYGNSKLLEEMNLQLEIMG